MSELLLITGAIAVAVLLLGIIVTAVVWKKRKEGKMGEPNYYAFFVMGICFLPIGIIFTTTNNPGFLAMTALGIIYMTIGLSNKNKWKTNKTKKASKKKTTKRKK